MTVSVLVLPLSESSLLLVNMAVARISWTDDITLSCYLLGMGLVLIPPGSLLGCGQQYTPPHDSLHALEIESTLGKALWLLSQHPPPPLKLE